ncbi:Phosphoribosylglycinamide formyltransferase [Parasponia andersonii]|uniref:phosphoribosylglycinamide formyltransferase 1 n=1 Tax=Parasponia andersonii TaxID=3476 RepID=A0A2P5ABY7_PARAD|nr:Phosphoribosylglycinamide formyltransferase [Parasponia andersonii]
MGANSMLSRFCSNIRISSIQSTKTLFSVTLLPPPLPSTPSFAQSHKWVSFRFSPCILLRDSNRNTGACQNSASVQVVGMSSAEDLGIGLKRKKLAVFVSGGGYNFRSILKASLQGSIFGDIVVLILCSFCILSFMVGCGGAEFVREKGIPIILFPRIKDEIDGVSPTNLVATLRGFEVDFVLLARYLKLIPAELIRAYPKSILNINPSLLPAFGGKGYYGMKVHKAVIASGARFSGPTIHFVDEHYDTGRILAQRVVPVSPNDTPEDLAARVLQEEHRLYVEVVEAICEDRITWRQDGVPLIRRKENPNEFR